MEKYLPEHIDPYRYAEQGLNLDNYTVKIKDLERLNALVSSHEGQVLVNLNFGVDEQGITYVKGDLKTQAVLQCQRCLDPFTYEIIARFTLGIVKTLDEAEELPEHYEPAMVKDNLLALRELIEDEILLNLPIIPRHEPEQCKVKLPYTDSEWKDLKDKSSPFHVLASLKDKRQ